MGHNLFKILMCNIKLFICLKVRKINLKRMINKIDKTKIYRSYIQQKNLLSNKVLYLKAEDDHFISMHDFHKLV